MQSSDQMAEIARLNQVDLASIRSRLDESMEQEALAKVEMEIGVALQRMAVTSLNNVSRVLTMPDTDSLTSMPAEVMKIRSRNFLVT